MIEKIETPSALRETGGPSGDKRIEILEFFGRINTRTEGISIARLTSEAGWSEPGQCPEFDEYTIVLSGELHVESSDGSVTIVKAGEAVLTPKGEWIRYSSPNSDADYIAVCLPAFGMELAHRNKE